MRGGGVWRPGIALALALWGVWLTGCESPSPPSYDTFHSTVAPTLAGASVISSGPLQSFPALETRRGRFEQASWAAAWIDPKQCSIDLAVYGRKDGWWTEHYATVEQLPRDIDVALNGTFFSLVDHEPVGVLVYKAGQEEFSPRGSKTFEDGHRPVVDLQRRYVAVLDDGQVVLGNSLGDRVDTLRHRIEENRAHRVQCLLGGAGPLVGDGKVCVSPAALRAAGFDTRSGLREDQPCRRTALGLTQDGRLLCLAVGLEGGGLSLRRLGALCLQLHAREAFFLDSGSSSGIRLGRSWQACGRSVPTWLVVRRKAHA